ncbi:hypothetical protein ACUSIJ_16320 [Pseudochelatococcus sp. B33]
MPFQLVDDFDVVAPWQALTPAAAPSAEIALATVDEAHPLAVSQGALSATFSGAAAGHRIRRAFGPLDLGAFDRLTFWFRPDSPLRGLAEDPFQVRLRLGSAALPLDDGANLWGRYVAGGNGRGWNFMVVSLSDLPPAIAAQAGEIEFQLAATDGTAHHVTFDAMELARPALAQDVDAALLARLDNVLAIGGNPVPARLSPEIAPRPYIAITQFGARRARARDPQGFRREERDDEGVLQWPAPRAWDLSYRFEPAADSRAEQAAILDFLAERLDSDWLPVGNRAFRLEKDEEPDEDDKDLPLPPLRYVVSAWAESGVPSRAIPVSTTRVSLDQRSQEA